MDEMRQASTDDTQWHTELQRKCGQHLKDGIEIWKKSIEDLKSNATEELRKDLQAVRDKLYWESRLFLVLRYQFPHVCRDISQQLQQLLDVIKSNKSRLGALEKEIKRAIDQPNERAFHLENFLHELNLNPADHEWTKCNGNCSIYGLDCQKDACPKCTMFVQNDHKGVTCDSCTRWYHLQCIGDFTEENYDYFTRETREFEWICKTCSEDDEASTDSSVKTKTVIPNTPQC